MKTNAWFLFERSKDLPGQWEALCLDLDVMTYGDNLEEAVRMGIEAAQMALFDDLEAGLDSRRRRAPEEDWQKLYELMARPERRSIPVGLLGQTQEELRIVAASLELSVPLGLSAPEFLAGQSHGEEPVGAILAA